MAKPPPNWHTGNGIDLGGEEKGGGERRARARERETHRETETERRREAATSFGHSINLRNKLIKRRGVRGSVRNGDTHEDTREGDEGDEGDEGGGSILPEEQDRRRRSGAEARSRRARAPRCRDEAG